MNWYTAKIIFSIHISGSGQATQFDEQLRIVSARNESEAFLKARMIGAREEDCFLNDSHNTVRWSFIDVADLELLPALTDGMELQSCIREREDAESYVRFVQSKALGIEERTQQLLATA